MSSTIRQNTTAIPDCTASINRVRALYGRLCRCRLCPRDCRTDRSSEKKGYCKSGIKPVVASASLHHGEEPPISGEKGSGTIFFTNCNMSCVYCQNYPISQLGVGNEISISGLAETMLTLQEKGAENINLVTPTHFAAQAVHAVYLARRKGLSIPIVWNSSGYESLETVKLLDGFVDIYLCDYRYATPEAAKKYSNAADYPFVVEEALEEMVRQVGIFDGRRGVIIRHLCLPGHLEETAEILRRIKEKFGPAIPVSFMSQYFPAYRASLYPEINRGLTAGEWRKAKKLFHETGLQAGWIQHDIYESV